MIKKTLDYNLLIGLLKQFNAS